LKTQGPFDGKYKHLTFSFLEEENIKDLEGRPRTHHDYDSKTLYIPADFIKKCTPGHRQWWELKRHNYDTVFFFKVNKNF
jgi:DNA mismatch repair protein MSH6